MDPLEVLTEQFNKLPGIGKKTAMRLAYYILTQPEEYAKEFSEAVIKAKSVIKYCTTCQNLSGAEICSICDSEKRDISKIMVVKSPKEVIAIEKTGEYNGLYHVLHGLISPMDGIGPNEIKLKELLVRLSKSENIEVILALSPTVEGEATVMYIAKLLKPLSVNVTKIAQGLPMGSDIEYADAATIMMAYKERRTV